jgi:hypothetical protein
LVYFPVLIQFMNYRIPVLLFFLFVSCAPSRNYVDNILKENPGQFGKILSDPAKYRVQIIYTRIDRNKKNIPRFTTSTYRLNDNEYFYPASTVKLPVALLALEKLNELGIDSLDLSTTMLTDSAWSGQEKIYFDSTAPDYLPSIGHYIKKLFLVSDNDAYNRLYEFLGPCYINNKLREKDYAGIRIIHRFAPLTQDENRHTNPIRFVDSASQVIYKQPPVYCDTSFNGKEPLNLGIGYISGDSLVHQPKDFSASNCLPLTALHELLISVLFHESVPGPRGFDLSENDYLYLMQCMSEYPRESVFPKYDEAHFYDSYVKFLMFGNNKDRIPGQFRIFNKVGLAYGFLTDAAYVVDFENGVEFLLSAVIYVNEDGIFNDDKYEYDSIGLPFLSQLGQLIYQQELKRHRKYKPDLSYFKLIYD